MIFLNKYKVFSNAKINIGLNVFEKNEDGYHDIDSIMVPVTLADEMEIEIYNESGDLEIECSEKKIPTDERNILYKAYKVFFENIETKELKIKVLLKKNIPSEAGLGGGSSNAAFFLKVLNEYSGNIYSLEELEKISMRIGSDVPFFIKNKTARVGGKGEKIREVENNLEDGLILIKPEFGVSTKEAYNNFDNLDEKKYSNFDEIESCLKTNNRVGIEKNIENSLEQAIENNIDIKMLKMTLNAVLPNKRFFMSGSGSTYYTFVTETERAQVETRLKTFVDNVKIIICGIKK
ncbi:4-(cytidine 5'-diphospho)-2-C-methyl-D-erythritol kinase [Fusobacterium massiliense]|uniref:4-(cytidine 5'-diphospho)-2-C-methyl-D-erythritol kinase n=1 Tax=Fusobacterium massiliense TaxID=1852365 RepID=UPI00093A63F4|nr:4-(cytidine 5'-diphospho)-2-C-methyl-D-erythritol kinase [Fusobacterium massiliense]